LSGRELELAREHTSANIHDSIGKIRSGQVQRMRMFVAAVSRYDADFNPSAGIRRLEARIRLSEALHRRLDPL
jgi:hypothetical protein